MIDNVENAIVSNSNAMAFLTLDYDSSETLSIDYVSPGIAQFGLDSHELTDGATNFTDIVHPDDCKRVLAEISEFERQNHTEYRHAFRLISRSGKVRWVESRMSLTKTTDNGRFRHQGVLTDITDTCLEMHRAGEIQSSLMPAVSPVVHGLDIAARSIPYNHAGGDFYDFVWNPDDPQSPVSVVVGDVSGHGLDSAIIGARASGYLRFGGLKKFAAAETLALMNRDLACYLGQTGHFLTLIHLTFAADRRSVEWVRAGHDAAYIYNPSGDEFTTLLGKGMALGVDKDQEFAVNRITGLEPGNVVAIGTDGICDSQNSEGEMFGSSRVKAIIREKASCSSREILAAVFESHAQFTHKMNRVDDMTLVIAKLQ